MMCSRCIIRGRFFLKASVAKEMKLIDHDKSRKELFSTKLIDAGGGENVRLCCRKQGGKLDRIAVYLGEISPAGGRGQGGISVAKVKDRRSRKDKQVKAVVVRLIPRRQRFGKRIYLSRAERTCRRDAFDYLHGRSAASGGYYISCAAIISSRMRMPHGLHRRNHALAGIAQAARKIGLRLNHQI